MNSSLLNKYHWIIYPLIAAFITRAIIFAGGTVAGLAISDKNAFVYREYQNMLIDPWGGWDGSWYRSIVMEGYYFYPAEQSSVAFFPLYPMLMYVTNSFLHNLNYAGMLVSFLCFLAALILLYRLAELEFGDRETANRTVFYIAAFPTAFFFSSVYTESLFLLMTVGSFYFARKRSWYWAALFGMLAAATRIVGILTLGAVMLEWMRSVGWTPATMFKREAWINLWQGLKREWFTVLVISTIAAGLLTYMFFLKLYFDDPTAFLTTQKTWGRQNMTPIEAIAYDFEHLKRGSFTDGTMSYQTLVNFCIVLTSIPIGVAAWRRLGASYGTFCLLSILIPLSGTSMSMTRFMLVNFPLFMMLGWWGRHMWLDRSLVMFFSLFLGVFSALFVNAYFIA